jgi:antitoxin (DNA-binding transcriptional repressor) of toxin-antitoxin stability system
LVYYLTMKMVNIYEAKARLSEYLDAVASGERVLICKRNQPVAELRAVPGIRATERPVGKAAGRLTVSPAFFDSLPADVVSAFSGEDGSGDRESGRVARVAERPPRYRTGSGRRRGR